MIKQTLARHGFDLTPAGGGQFTVSCGSIVMFTMPIMGIIAWMRQVNIVKSDRTVSGDTAGGTSATKPSI